MKLARPLPDFMYLMGLELLFSIGIIGSVIAVIMPSYEVAMNKARLSGFTTHMGAEIHDRMINMALTGEGYFAGSSAPLADKKQSEPLVDGLVVKEIIIGNSIRHEGSLGGQSFYLTYGPSVIAEGPIGSVMWLCGNKKPLAGWTRPAQTGTDLPPEIVPFDCRN